MSKLTPTQWGEIEAKYKLGHPVREMAAQYEYDASNIVKKAKKLGWSHGQITTITTNTANSINELTSAITTLPQSGKAVVKQELINLAGLQSKAKDVQNDLMELIQLTTKKTKAIIENSVDGLYIKGESSNGTQYGRVSEFVKDLTSAMPATNMILGLDKGTEVTTNIQTNGPEIRIVRKE